MPLNLDGYKQHRENTFPQKDYLPRRQMLCLSVKKMCRRSGILAEATNLVPPRRPKRRRRVQGFRRRVQNISPTRPRITPTRPKYFADASKNISPTRPRISPRRPEISPPMWLRCRRDQLPRHSGENEGVKYHNNKNNAQIQYT